LPRRYTLGKRGDAMAETRERVIAATLRLYREGGISSATVPAVARAADVSPATVRNHFPTPADLAEAAAGAILVELRMPGVEIFGGCAGALERLERLLVEVSAFYERSTGWWEVREADRVAGNAWEGPESAYQAAFATLIRAAVSPLDDDVEVVAVVGSVLINVYFGLRATGHSAERTVEVQRELLVPWLTARLSALKGRPSGQGPDSADRDTIGP
jgi:AcrR family transcriptional regulator